MKAVCAKSNFSVSLMITYGALSTIKQGYNREVVWDIKSVVQNTQMIVVLSCYISPNYKLMLLTALCFCCRCPVPRFYGMKMDQQAPLKLSHNVRCHFRFTVPIYFQLSGFFPAAISVSTVLVKSSNRSGFTLTRTC